MEKKAIRERVGSNMGVGREWEGIKKGAGSN